MTFEYLIKSSFVSPFLPRQFQALGSPTRFQIFMHLCSIDEGQVSKICGLFHMSGNGVYKHLEILEQVELVRSYKFDGEGFYSAHPEALLVLEAWLSRVSRQLHNRNKDYDDTHNRYHLGNAEKVGGNSREENWYRQRQVEHHVQSAKDFAAVGIGGAMLQSGLTNDTYDGI